MRPIGPISPRASTVLSTKEAKRPFPFEANAVKVSSRASRPAGLFRILSPFPVRGEVAIRGAASPASIIMASLKGGNHTEMADRVSSAIFAHDKSPDADDPLKKRTKLPKRIGMRLECGSPRSSGGAGKQGGAFGSPRFAEARCLGASAILNYSLSHSHTSSIDESCSGVRLPSRR